MLPGGILPLVRDGPVVLFMWASMSRNAPPVTNAMPQEPRLQTMEWRFDPLHEGEDLPGGLISGPPQRLREVLPGAASRSRALNVFHS